MEDLQSLLERINREGVEKAEAEAKKIVDSAHSKADAIVNTALDEAEKARSAADRDSAAYVERANASLKQSARDVVISVQDAITSLLEKALVKNVEKALADEKTAVELVSTAIKDLTGPGEITCGPKIAQALASQVASAGSFTVVTNENVGSGFSIKIDNGRVEHTFTSDVIAAELSKRLRPDLAALLKQ